VKIRLMTIHAVGRWEWNLARQCIEYIPHGKQRPTWIVPLTPRDNNLERATVRAVRVTARNPAVLKP
jgi:hypothetical protein